MIKRLLPAFVLTLILATTTVGLELHPRFKLNISERFRMVSWDNAITLDKNADASRAFTRHRTRISGTWQPLDKLEIGFGLANEFRYYFTPNNTHLNLDEVFIDPLYIKWSHVANSPATLTVGRQNIILGEGFIVMDGHPLDGSRSIYFNAVRLDVALADDHKVTAFYSYQPKIDDWLPVAHDRDQELVEQPEQGLGLYYMGKSGRNDIDGYLLVKNLRQTASRPKSHIYTLGTKINRPFGRKFLASLEGAYQFGDYDSIDRAAYGLHTHVDYTPRNKTARFCLPSKMTAGAIVLSGDNPGTDTFNDWDPGFARWPKWSESYIYTQVFEDAVAYWTNLISLYGRLHFDLDDGVGFNLDYYHLMADHRATIGQAFPGGDGTTRGKLVIGKLNYRFSKYWSGHILWEYFEPGDYYFENADSYGWLRLELMFRI